MTGGPSGGIPIALAVLKNGPPQNLVHPRFHQALARELHLSGDNEEALAVSDLLIENLPSGYNMQRLRVAILSALARYDDALGELETLVEERPQAPARALQDELLLTRLLERVGRPEEAAP